MLKGFLAYVKKTDWLLPLSAALLFVFGMMALFSLSEAGAISSEVYWKQLGFGVAGLAIVFFVSTLNVRIFQRYGISVMLVYAAALLGLLGLFVFGESIRGNRAWYHILGFSLAPVEFAKISFLLLLAKFFSDRHRDLYTVRHIAISLIYLLLLVVPVLAQPDVGSAVVLVLLWAGVVLFTGIRFKWIAILFIAAALASVGAWKYGLKPYQKERIIIFLDPEKSPKGIGYNTIQSKIAVGSGGLFGKGLGSGSQGTQKFLPEASTDFIFSAIAEESGLAGVLIMIGLFCLLWYRILRAGLGAANNFGRIFAFGFAWLLAIHFFINTGMNLGMLPVIGLPLPFVSYGGSHILAAFIGIGLLIAISKQIPERPRAQHLG